MITIFFIVKGIGIGFFLYAAGAHPYAFVKALVRACCDEKPYSNAMSIIGMSVSLKAKAAKHNRLLAIYSLIVIPTTR